MTHLRTGSPAGLYQSFAGRLRHSWDPFRTLVFLLTIVTISRVHQQYSFLSAFRPALLLVAGAGIYAVLNWRALNQEGLFRTWPPRIMVALLGWACLSAVFGLSLGGSATFILDTYSKVIIYALLVVMAIRRVEDLSLMIWAYVISCGILVWMAMFVFDMSQAAGTHNLRLQNLHKYDSNDLGLVLMVGLPLTLLTLQTSAAKGKLFSALVLVGIGSVIAKSGSRGAFVTFVVVGVWMLIALKQVSVVKRAGFVAVALLALLASAPPGYWEQMNTITEPTEDYNWEEDYGRRKIALRGLKYTSQYPVFGLGINNFPRAEGTISEMAQRAGGNIRWKAAHNSYVQASSEMGVPGFFLWLFLVFGGLVSARRLRKRLPQGWRYGDAGQRFLHQTTVYLPIAFLAFAVNSFFLSFAWVDHLYFLGALLAGLYVSIETKIAEGGAQQAAPIRVAGWRSRRPAPAEVPMPSRVPA